MRRTPTKIVALLIGEISGDAAFDEQENLVQAALSATLTDLDYYPVTIPFRLDFAATQRQLKTLEPWCVINLVESIEGQCRLIHLAPALLDDLALPYAGCGTAAMQLTSDKVLSKYQFRAAGLPTPDWFCGSALPSVEPFCGPWIVKSRHVHSSFGLDQTAVTDRWVALPELIAERQHRYGGEWFIEQYIDGREFNFSILGPKLRPIVLPAAEMLFIDYPIGKPRIVDYAAKWIKDSFEYCHTIRTFQHEWADAAILRKLYAIALACWRLTACQGYARVDTRIDAAGRCWILEVNANPGIGPDSGFTAAAAKAGLDFGEMVTLLLQAMVMDHSAKFKPVGDRSPSIRKGEF